jgi:hypothetical protein
LGSPPYPQLPAEAHRGQHRAVEPLLHLPGQRIAFDAETLEILQDGPQVQAYGVDQVGCVHRQNSALWAARAAATIDSVAHLSRGIVRAVAL